MENRKGVGGPNGPSLELLYNRLSTAYEEVLGRLLEQAAETLGEEGISLALADFLLWPDDEDEFRHAYEAHAALFVPFLIFDWTPDPDDIDPEVRASFREPLARQALANPIVRLDPLERRIVEAALEEPLSFHEVIACRPGEGFTLRDILRGRETEVCERLGSESVQPGDILFARVIRIEQVGMLAGCGDLFFPPDFKPQVIELRTKILRRRKAITAEDLRRNATDLRDLFFALHEVLTAPPELRNSDDEEILFHRLHWEIDSAAEAFERLKHLAGDETPENILARAERTADGNLSRVQFAWIGKGSGSPGLRNVVLGKIAIEEGKLRVEVNSAGRAARIREAVDRALGKTGRHRATEVLGRMPSPSAQDEEAAPPEQILESPEARAELGRLFENYWAEWTKTKIPALGGKTPRQAVRSAEGRESVEAILASAERDAARTAQFPEEALAAIRNARRLLGLS